MIVKPRFYVKAPIQGIQFSNEEVGLEIEYETSDDNWEEVNSNLMKQMKLVVKDYMDKLSSEIEDGQSKVIEKLQVDLAKTYEDKLSEASKEIYKLRDLLKENGITY